jgi:hypothetical protein
MVYETHSELSCGQSLVTFVVLACSGLISAMPQPTLLGPGQGGEGCSFLWRATFRSISSTSTNYLDLYISNVALPSIPIDIELSI